MTYLDTGIRIDIPSLDAAAHLADRIGAAEHDARIKADDTAAAKPAADAIKAIRAIDLTPAVCAYLTVVLRNRVSGASWGHFEHVEQALDLLDDAHDALAGVTR